MILSTRGTFGRATDMTFLSEFVVTEPSQTPSTPTYGGAHVGMFGVGFFSIDGGVIAMIVETLFSQEGAVTRRARVSGDGIAFVRAVGVETRGTILTLQGCWVESSCSK